MEEKIYFGTKDGRLVSSTDLVEMAHIVKGIEISVNDFTAIREFADKCQGISKEIKYPSVLYCATHGQLAIAVKLYRYRHPGTGLKEAYDIIKDMENNPEKYMKSYCITTTDLGNDIMYLAYSDGSKGYFWTHLDSFREILHYSTEDHPFIFDTKNKAIQLLKKEKIPQKCRILPLKLSDNKEEKKDEEV